MYGFLNAAVKDSNNKIKANKRKAYGVRSFKNFRLLILISFKNCFYSMNYKQKAADLIDVKSAA
ncbi:transposase [Weissella cibaria]|uniref:transposase n=1 Tax=Weissella cibaria TaxID=137591 RepID=UPI0020922B6A|nr:transposase [uncultured Weissella sp.]